MAAVTRSRAIKARRLLSSRVMVCVTVLDMQRQLTDLRPEVLSWLATVPVAERATDGEEPSTIYFKEPIRSVASGSRYGTTKAMFVPGRYSLRACPLGCSADDTAGTPASDALVSQPSCCLDCDNESRASLPVLLSHRPASREAARVGRGRSPHGPRS